MSIMRISKQKGFTIVELVIVIVVIGILASIAIVSYGGAQQRAQDVKRVNAMSNLKDALEIYFIANNIYPTCSGNGICTSTGIYGPISALPMTPPMENDPVNIATQYGYYYARGYKKTGPNTFIQTNLQTDYIIGTRLVNSQVPVWSGWDNSSLNYLDGN